MGPSKFISIFHLNIIYITYIYNIIPHGIKRKKTCIYPYTERIHTHARNTQNPTLEGLWFGALYEGLLYSVSSGPVTKPEK